MVVTERSTLIRRPVEDVFRYVSHMEYLPEWAEGITASRQISGLSPGTGAIYRCTIGPSVAGIGITGDYKMVDFQENRRIVCRLDSPMLSFEDIYLFESADGDTRLRVRDSLKPPFFLFPAEIVLSNLVRDRMEKAHNNLIERLEDHARKRSA